MRSVFPTRRRALLALAGLCLSAAFGPSLAAAPLKAVASFSILGDIVREVGGGDVSVDTLVGPDGDAHEYEPTPGDAKKLSAAGVLFVNGLDFETWMPRLAKSSGFSGQTVVASKGVAPRKFAEAGGKGDHDDHDHGHDHGHDHKEAHHHGDADPHAWQDLSNGVIYARNVAEGLAAADPGACAGLSRAGPGLHRAVAGAGCRGPQDVCRDLAERRKVVTSHDASAISAMPTAAFIPAMGVSTGCRAVGR